MIDARGLALLDTVRQLADSGVSLLQFRDKNPDKADVLKSAEQVRNILAPYRCRLILNDHTDLAASLEADGVHLGQSDLAPAAARVLLPSGLIGISTHSDEQIITAGAGAADYIAVGPIFTTNTKQNTAPVVGLDLVRRARALTAKPVVAIGGITRTNAQSVLEAGADSIAIISALLVPGERVDTIVRDFLDILR